MRLRVRARVHLEGRVLQVVQTHARRLRHQPRLHVLRTAAAAAAAATARLAGRRPERLLARDFEKRGAARTAARRRLDCEVGAGVRVRMRVGVRVRVRQLSLAPPVCSSTLIVSKGYLGAYSTRVLRRSQRTQRVGRRLGSSSTAARRASQAAVALQTEAASSRRWPARPPAAAA